MNKWRTYKLGEISEVISRGISPKYNNEGVGVINQKCVRDGKIKFNDIKFNDTNLKKVAADKYLRKNDILINSTGTGTLGRVGQINFDIINFTYDSHVTLVRVKEEFSQVFVGYKLKALQPYIESLAEGSTGQTELSREKVKGIEINLPDLSTQHEIASIVSSLDDKIELNLQMNQTLEAMAQAIFKEWFVDFNFPGFDGELVDGLPKGWKYKTIKKLGKVVTGNTPSSKNPEYFGEITPFVTPTDFKNFSKLIIDTNRFLSNEGKISMKTRLLPENSIVVTCIGSDMGKVAINKVECVTNQQINSIIPNDKIFVDYLYYDLVYKYDLLRNIATGGSTMPIINKSRFEEIEILIPNPEILEKFQDLMDSLNSKIEENIRHSNSLAQIRDTLLPQLITGKIEIEG